MKHLKLFDNFNIQEGRFWRKDTDIADKILKAMDNLDPEDIQFKKYSICGDKILNIHEFSIQGKKQNLTSDYPISFNIKSGSSVDGVIDIEYTTYADDLELDISQRKSKQIFLKAKQIMEDRSNTENRIKKSDMREML